MFVAFERRKGVLVIPIQPRGELRRFENSRNVEINLNVSAAELNWRGQSALLAGIVLAGLFVYLFQTHPFEEFALNLEVIAITLGKVTEKAGRSAIAQGVDQCPNTVIYKISFAPNLCHNDCPRFVRRRVLSSILQPLAFIFQARSSLAFKTCISLVFWNRQHQPSET